jgi:hypothetical protein
MVSQGERVAHHAWPRVPVSAPPALAKTESGSPFLLAVLANPPLHTKSRSFGRVELAARILGLERMRIVNLFAVASTSSRDIAALGHEPHGWTTARRPIMEALAEADQVLVGFGAIPVTGAARRNLEEQLHWLGETFRLQGHNTVWQVGQARHPSRWHQYVSDRYGRTAGGSFEVRLREVLTCTETAALPWASKLGPSRRSGQRA